MATIVRYWEEQIPKVLPQILGDESSTKKMTLGYIHKEANGDEWIYCKNAAVALAAGKLIQSVAANATKWSSLDVPDAGAAAVGTNVIQATLGSGGGVTANDFADGYIHIQSSAGAGETYRIYSHDTAAAGAVCTFTIYGVLNTAITTDTQVCITRNPCSNVIVTAASAYPTAQVVGVPQRTVTANYYFWAKKKGFSAVLSAGTLLIAKMCAASNAAVDGAVEPWVLDTGTPDIDNDLQLVGLVIQVGANTEYGLVNLNL